MNSVYDMVVSFLRHGEVESQTEMATYVLFTVHADADTNRHRQTKLLHTYYLRYTPTPTPTPTDTDRHRQTPTFKSFFYPDKPIGASPRRDYVQTRMVLLYEYNLVLYFMVRNDTLKKGGNAPRATDEKRFLSSASLILEGI